MLHQISIMQIACIISLKLVFNNNKIYEEKKNVEIAFHYTITIKQFAPTF